MNVRKDACYQNPKVCFYLDLIAKKNVFSSNRKFLKTVWNLNYGIAFKESALYRLTLASHKKRIIP